MNCPGTYRGARITWVLMTVCLFASLRIHAADGRFEVGIPDRSNVFADSPELLEIQHRDRDGEVRSYPGVLVQVSDDESTILTSALDRRGVLSVVDGETTLTAEVIRVDPARNLSLLKTPGLRQDAVVPGRSRLGMNILSVSLRGVAKGQVTGIRRDSDAVITVVHDMGIQSPGVLLDECGQLVAVNQSEAPTALGIDSVMDFLAASQVPMGSQKGCENVLATARLAFQEASERARIAQDQAEQANDAVSALEARLSVSSRRNDELERRAGEARAEADRAAREAAVARALVDDARIQFEQKTRDIETSTTARINEVEAGRRAAEQRLQTALEAQVQANRNRDQLLLLVALVVIVAGLIGVVVWLRMRHVTVSAPEATVRPSNGSLAGQQDVILEGKDDEGARFRVKAGIDRLEKPGGMVIGRHPRDSELLIEHPDVSRRHARIRVVGRQLYLEDLGSTNGTSVNGRAIDQKGQVILVEGDRVVLGSVRLNVGRA